LRGTSGGGFKSFFTKLLIEGLGNLLEGEFMKLTMLLMGMGLALATACAPATHSTQNTIQDQPAIFGGDEVSGDDVIATTTVGLYNQKVGYLCTGSLAGQNFVITAGHCLEGDPKDIEVRFGPDMRQPLVKRKVVAGLRHPQYSIKIQDNMHDISVLKYEGTIPQGYRPAVLLKDYSILNQGTNVIAAGYGLSIPTLKYGAGTLRKITLQVSNPNKSQTEISLDQGMFHGVCSGDSGGPAFFEQNGKLYLWGVTSNGAGLPLLNQCMFFSVFTRIDAYLNWIVATTQAL
jgi:hypothetical protein